MDRERLIQRERHRHGNERNIDQRMCFRRSGPFYLARRPNYDWPG